MLLFFSFFFFAAKLYHESFLYPRDAALVSYVPGEAQHWQTNLHCLTGTL